MNTKEQKKDRVELTQENFAAVTSQETVSAKEVSESLLSAWNDSVNNFLNDFSSVLDKHKVSIVYDEDDFYFRVDNKYVTDSVESILEDMVKGFNTKNYFKKVFNFNIVNSNYPLAALEYKILLDSLLI